MDHMNDEEFLQLISKLKENQVVGYKREIFEKIERGYIRDLELKKLIDGEE